MSDATITKPRIQSVSRAIAILRCFSDGKEHGLTEVSKMVALHKSTTASIINTLKMEGFLEQNPRTDKFLLGLAVFTLAVNARQDLSMICEPHLNRLLELTGETVNLAVLDHERVETVYIAKKESKQSVRISTSIGKRLPLHCTAIGKSILANMSKHLADELLERLVFTPFTDRTITNKAVLLTELDMIKKRGFAYDDEEFEVGVVCVAVPISDRFGEPIGAISVSGPLMRLDSEKRLEIATILRSEKKEIDGKMLMLV